MARLRSNQFKRVKQLLGGVGIMEAVVLIVIAWIAIIVALEGRTATQ
ncbi:MAG: hypothetical protein ABWY52_01790 [Candidatus Limnocylindrales bacterium]